MVHKKLKGQVIFGRNPILEALRSDQQFEKIVLKSGLKGPFVQELYEICTERAIPIKKVPTVKLDYISRGKNHQGVIGYMSAIEYQDIRNILPFLFEQGTVPNFLILDGVTDVRNLGAIARSAEVLGVNAIILPLANSAQINEDAIKTSAGALMNIPVCRSNSISRTISYLKESGVTIVSSSLKAEKHVFDIDLTVPLAVILGSEYDGVQGSLLAESDEIFKIPQQGQIDSLNVSVAAGIILYECLHQRLKQQ